VEKLKVGGEINMVEKRENPTPAEEIRGQTNMQIFASLFRLYMLDDPGAARELPIQFTPSIVQAMDSFQSGVSTASEQAGLETARALVSHIAEKLGLETVVTTHKDTLEPFKSNLRPGRMKPSRAAHNMFALVPVSKRRSGQ